MYQSDAAEDRWDALLRFGVERLPGNERDAALLLAAALGISRATLLAFPERSAATAVRARYLEWIDRRSAGEPVAYLLGRRGFWSLELEITPAVLVPRPETEELLERAVAFVRAHPNPSPVLCDVGTGSGILAISAAAELPSLRCTALDVSPPALAIARRNAQALGVASRVTFLESDLLDALAAGARFDCVVANLPYVESAAIAAAPDPVSFEPRLALDGGPDGLALYRRLLAALEPHLAPGAAAYFEAGPATTGFLAELAAAALPNATVTVHTDYAAHPRIVEIRT